MLYEPTKAYELEGHKSSKTAKGEVVQGLNFVKL